MMDGAAGVADINGIILKKGIFRDGVTLDLFYQDDKADNDKPDDNKRACFIYGRNGSGKSTISQAIADYKANAVDAGNIFLDRQHKPLALSDEARASIYVFNETYISDTVQMQDDGLQTIVVLGPQVGIEKELNELEKKIEQEKTTLKQHQLILEDKENPQSLNSYKYYMNRMIGKLKGDDSWAGYDKRIRGNRTNTAVNEAVVKKWATQPAPAKDEEALREARSEALRQLQEADSGVTTVDKVGLINTNTDFQTKIEENAVRELMEQRIEKPELTERDRLIMEIMQQYPQKRNENFLPDRRKFFSAQGEKVCPYCFQNVSEEYAASVAETISKILNEHVKTYQRRLQEYRLSELQPQISGKTQALEKLTLGISHYQQIAQKFNEAVQKYNHALDDRCNDPYAEVHYVNCGLKKIYATVELAEKTLNELIVAHNAEVADKGKFVQNGQQANNELAYYYLKDDYQQYRQAVDSCEAMKRQVVQDRTNLEKLYNKRRALEEQRRNVAIALNDINEDLAYIFYDRQRLYIKYDNIQDQYILYSHGDKVRPKDASTGERNAVALVYFFHTMVADRDVETAVQHPYFLVLDDPLSSFDYENRIGIMSYLHREYKKLLSGNKQTKIVTLTHDIQFLLEISARIGKFQGPAKSVCWELRDNVIRDVSRPNEYSEALKIVYEYARQPYETYEPFIGNLMRRILEAYSTFNYQTGIDEILFDQNITSRLPDKIREHFASFFARTLLNSDSHMKNRANLLNDPGSFENASDQEKQRVARELLCFLYMMDKQHVICKLKNRSNFSQKIYSTKEVEQTINKWCKSLA